MENKHNRGKSEDLGMARDRRFFDDLVENVQEIKEEAKAGAKIEDKLEQRNEARAGDEVEQRAAISHEEAKQMMAAEKARIEREMQKTHGKNQRILIIVLIVAAVLCIVGVILAMVIGGQKQSSDTDKKDDTAVVEPEEKPEPEQPNEAELEARRVVDVEDIVGKMKTALGAYLVDDGKELFVFEDGDGVVPLYQRPDMQTAIRLNKGIGFVGNSVSGAKDDVIWGKINDEAYAALIEKVFADNGFVKVGEDWVPRGEYINYETGVVCTNVGTGQPIYFGCGHISWLDEDEVAMVDQLAEAYREKTGYGMAIMSSVAPEDIENSVVAPYQKLRVNLYGALGLFYRVSPEAEWQFFVAAQSSQLCSEYDTEDLRKAYAGEVCYEDDHMTESTVQP